jgi:hypothetical protein
MGPERNLAERFARIFYSVQLVAVDAERDASIFPDHLEHERFIVPDGILSIEKSELRKQRSLNKQLLSVPIKAKVAAPPKDYRSRRAIELGERELRTNSSVSLSNGF